MSERLVARRMERRGTWVFMVASGGIVYRRWIEHFHKECGLAKIVRCVLSA